jgi:hypothetical protein
VVDVALVNTEQSTVEFPKDHRGELIEKKEDKWSVRIHLRPVPSKRLKQVMREPSPRHLALLVDGNVVVAPRVGVGTDEDDLTIDMGTGLNQAESLLEAQRLWQLLSRPSAPVGR